MTPIEFSSSIQALLGLFLVCCLWHYGWRQLAIDAYRQDLFEARDRLFDLASGISATFDFKHPAYGSLRRQFNGTIRFAHRLNMIQILIFRFFIGPRFEQLDTEKPLEEMLESVDDATKKEILAIRDLWSQATTRFLFRTSPLFYFPFLLIAARVITAAIGGYLAKKVKVPIEGFKIISDRISNGFNAGLVKLSSIVWDDVAHVDRWERKEQEETHTADQIEHLTA